MKKKEEEIDSVSKKDQKLAEEIEQYNVFIIIYYTSSLSMIIY